MRPFWVDAIIWVGFWVGMPKFARAAGRDCMVCWLIGQWEKEKDPRAKREDRYKLAAQIAENKGIRIKVSDSVPVKEIAPVPENPLAKFTTTELMAEIDRRKTA